MRWVADKILATALVQKWLLDLTLGNLGHCRAWRLELEKSSMEFRFFTVSNYLKYHYDIENITVTVTVRNHLFWERPSWHCTGPESVLYKELPSYLTAQSQTKSWRNIWEICVVILFSKGIVTTISIGFQTRHLSSDKWCWAHWCHNKWHIHLRQKGFVIFWE